MTDYVLLSETYFCGLSHPWKGRAPHPGPCCSLEPSEALTGAAAIGRAQPHHSSSHSHAVIFLSDLPKSNQTNSSEAPIHLNKHYSMKRCLGPCRAQLKPWLISGLWKQIMKQSSCPETPPSPLADGVFDSSPTNPCDFTFLQSLFWFWDAQPFPPKVYLYYRKRLFNVLCARVYLL